MVHQRALSCATMFADWKLVSTFCFVCSGALLFLDFGFCDDFLDSDFPIFYLIKVQKSRSFLLR